MDPPTSWDSLRKQARKLEAQLDEQMHLYRKLVSTKVDNSNDNDLESGIDQLLKQLQQVNVQMQAWVSSGGSEIFSHTLTRHQEIFQDLMQEFKRLHSSQRAKKEHASLLEDFREFDRTRLDLEDGGGSYDQALLKERASLHRSSGQMDSVISQAQETLKSIVFQRSTFGGINSKLSNVSSRLPTVNHILSAIKKKKSMDTIILSLVASVCTFLILIYWWTKNAILKGECEIEGGNPGRQIKGRIELSEQLGDFERNAAVSKKSVKEVAITNQNATSAISAIGKMGLARSIKAQSKAESSNSRGCDVAPVELELVPFMEKLKDCDVEGSSTKGETQIHVDAWEKK
ncbi:Golgi SNAP receptor complex member 1-1 [Sesamum angolense]|uniref:Golgi SNAP receptor complex member 1-1 n=1 Tax=Sesamum angolense TaxID=2727404 RepID=A0AAE2BKG9_9LAMI|nr:Golgi SNAP receptor complex member 1-1 [Sesamum angolense]